MGMGDGNGNPECCRHLFSVSFYFPLRLLSHIEKNVISFRVNTMLAWLMSFRFLLSFVTFACYSSHVGFRCWLIIFSFLVSLSYIFTCWEFALSVVVLLCLFNTQSQFYAFLLTCTLQLSYILFLF